VRLFKPFGLQALLSTLELALRARTRQQQLVE
jgi:hypothetical protein